MRFQWSNDSFQLNAAAPGTTILEVHTQTLYDNINYKGKIVMSENDLKELSKWINKQLRQIRSVKIKK